MDPLVELHMQERHIDCNAVAGRHEEEIAITEALEGLLERELMKWLELARAVLSWLRHRTEFAVELDTYSLSKSSRAVSWG